MLKRFTEKDIEYIKTNLGKISLKEIAANLDRNYSSVQSKIRYLGLQPQGRGKSPFSRKKNKYVCNEEYFSQDSIESYYWAGFIAADGWVASRDFQLGILLAGKDINHLKLFKEAIQSTNPIHIRKNGSVVIRLSSRKVSNDLKNKFNITTKKTFTLKFPDIKNKERLDAFILGYIDGDGCIYNTNGRLGLQVVGTQDFLLGVQKRFNEILGTATGVAKNGNIYRVTITGKKANKLFEHFYQLEVPKLNRKWTKERFENLFITP